MACLLCEINPLATFPMCGMYSNPLATCSTCRTFKPSRNLPNVQDVLLEPFCNLHNVAMCKMYLNPFATCPMCRTYYLNPFVTCPMCRTYSNPHLRLALCAGRTLPTWIKGRTCYSPRNMMAHTNTLYFSWVPTPSEALENILKYPEIGQPQSFICKHLHGCMRVMGLNGWESVLMLSLTDFLRFFFFFFGELYILYLQHHIILIEKKKRHILMNFEWVMTRIVVVRLYYSTKRVR